MKKIFSGLLLLCMTLTVFAAQRTVEEAAALAAQFFNDQPAQKGIRRAQKKGGRLDIGYWRFKISQFHISNLK